MPEAPLRLVYLEDDDSAFELVRYLLAAEFAGLELVHAVDEETYRAALLAAPDLILSDYNLPTIDGMAALELRGRLRPDTPFIFVSGALGEAVAIDLLKAGVTDFVLKDAMPRLVPAIRRSIAEAQMNRGRVVAERSLRESEERFRRLTENAPDVIFRFRFEPQPGYDYISPAVERISGYRPAEFYADPLLAGKLAHPDDRAKIQTILATRTVPEGTHEIKWLARDGRTLITEQRFVAINDEEGRLVAIEGIARDITEVRQDRDRRRALEAQLNQAQKMESIGAMAGGIAHDFNNIMTGILGFAEIARQSVHDGAVVGECVEEIRQAGQRAKALVAQIMTFSNQRGAKHQPVELADVVGDNLRLIRASAPAAIAIERQLAPGKVLGDQTQLDQVVLNLATNAVHALGGGPGTLTVTLERVEVDRALATRISGLSPGPCMRLQVADTGHGMDPPTMAKIFEPFFTTKPAGEGSGLGLAVVLGIVRAHRGGMTVASAVGQGTTFSVYLPLCAESAPIAADPPGPSPGLGAHVLLVDDELSIGHFAGVRLQQLQYRATVFQDPLRALSAFQASPQTYDALVCDFAMPGIVGLQLIREARRLVPELPAILITGNRLALPPDELATFPGLVVMDKPFTGDELGLALQSVLRSPDRREQV